VAQYMGGDAFVLQGKALHSGGLYVLGQQIFHAVAAESLSSGT